ALFSCPSSVVRCTESPPRLRRKTIPCAYSILACFRPLFLLPIRFRPRFVTARQVPHRYGRNLLLNMGEIRGCLRLPLVRCPVLGLRCTEAGTQRAIPGSWSVVSCSFVRCPLPSHDRQDSQGIVEAPLAYNPR